MRIMYKIFVTAFISSLFFVLFVPNSVFAATCNARQLASSAPFWGDDSGQNVSATVSTNVKISGIGSGQSTATADEASCIGKNAEFQVFKENTIVTTASGVLQSSGVVSGRQKFFINWTIPANYQAGDYKVKLIKIDGQNVSTNLSGNLLQVGTTQSCVFDGSPSVSPTTVNQFGTSTNVTITVRVKPAQGAAASACDNWSISGFIFFDQPRSEVSNLGSHRVAAGARSIIFTWDSRGKNPGIYRFKASMGSQNIESGQFFLEGTNTHKECRNNACVVVTGAGQDRCSTDTQCAASPAPRSSGSQSFEIRNPLEVDNLQDLVNIIGRWIFNLAIPIAVIMIIYAGGLMLTSGGNPKRFGDGMTTLRYAVIGLAIILIGKGFVSLIQSVLNLRN